MADNESLKERLEKQFAQLCNDRSSFETHWRELSDFINPRGSRFLTSDVNRDGWLILASRGLLQSAVDVIQSQVLQQLDELGQVVLS